MANNTVAEMRVSQGAVTGAIFWGPTGTALPTDATTALNVAFKNLGYVGSDGITPARAISTDVVKDMNGASLRTVQTDFEKTYQALLYQTLNVDVNGMIFGSANVTVTAGDPTHGERVAIMDKGIVASQGILIIETYDGGAKQRRIGPAAQPTSTEEGPLVGSNVQSYTLTWSEYPDSSGVYEYRYNDNGVLAP